MATSSGLYHDLEALDLTGSLQGEARKYTKVCVANMKIHFCMQHRPSNSLKALSAGIVSHLESVQQLLYFCCFTDGAGVGTVLQPLQP